MVNRTSIITGYVPTFIASFSEDTFRLPKFGRISCCCMRIREWTEYLEDGFALSVRLTTDRNTVVEFAVVLIRDGEMITRWDCAHGIVHRDVYGRKYALVMKEFRVYIL